jgi:hypothetical protein
MQPEQVEVVREEANGERRDPHEEVGRLAAQPRRPPVWGQ